MELCFVPPSSECNSPVGAPRPHLWPAAAAEQADRVCCFNRKCDSSPEDAPSTLALNPNPNPNPYHTPVPCRSSRTSRCGSATRGWTRRSPASAPRTPARLNRPRRCRPRWPPSGCACASLLWGTHQSVPHQASVLCLAIQRRRSPASQARMLVFNDRD